MTNQSENVIIHNEFTIILYEGVLYIMRQSKKLLTLLIILLITVGIAGCGGSQASIQRISGLAPTDVIKTFINAAQRNNLTEAGLYVSPASKNDPQTVLKYLAGQSDLTLIKNANLIAVKQVAQQGDYAAVLTTLQEQNTLKIIIRPVGLEKINGEWYIVDFNQIYTDAKYKVLQNLLQSI